MKPKARISNGLFAAALGLTTAFAGGTLWDALGGSNSVLAQAMPPQNQMLQSQPLTLEQALAVSNAKLFDARKAAAVKDLATAERLIGEVKAMNLPYREQDAQPDSVLQLVQYSRQVTKQLQTGGDTAQIRRDYAIFLMHQAGGLLQYGETDLATQLTREAQAQGITYNQADVQAGLEPSAMFKRIEDVKRIKSAAQQAPVVPMSPANLSAAMQRDLNQGISFVQQSRQALNKGQLDQAEQLCHYAVNLKLPENVYPQQSETPSKLLAEIAAKRANFPVQNTVVPSTASAQQAVYHPSQDNTQNIQVNAGQNGAPLVDMKPMTAANAPAMNVQKTAMVDQARREREVVLQQVASGIMQQISDAQKISREQRNPEAGLDILRQARVNVEQSPLDAATKASFIKNIDRSIEETVQFTQRYENQRSQEQINQQVMAERKLEQDQFRNREEQLKTYVMECNKLIDEQRYEEAVFIAKKARELAPEEPAANMLLTSTQLAWNVSRSMDYRERKEEGFVNAMLDVDKAAIPYSFDNRGIVFSKNWEEMKRRGRKTTDQIMQQRRPESEQEILRRLEMPVSLNIGHPLPLGQIFQLLQGQTGVDFFVDWPALAEVDVTTDTPVTISVLKEIKLRSALNLILEQLNLSYVVRNEMLNITSSTKAKGQLYTEYYYVGDLIMSIPNFDGRNNQDFNAAYGRAMQYAVNNGQQNRMNGSGMPDPKLAAVQNVSSSQNLLNPNINAQMGATSAPFSTGGMNGGMSPMGGTNNLGAAGGGSADFGPIMDLIEAVVSPDSWSSGGGDGEMTEYLPNLSLVVRQTEEVHAELVELLNQLRKLNDLQIAVEVRYITISDDFYEKMGVDFNLKFRNDAAESKIDVKDEYSALYSSGSSNNSNSTSNNSNSSNSSSSSTIGEYIKRGNNVTVGLSAPGTTGFTDDLSIPFTQNSYTLAVPQYGNYVADAGTSFGFALLSNIEAYFFMQASQGDTRSNLLQAPKVMIFNGQMGTISDQSSSPFVISVIPVVGDFAAAYQPMICILNEGQIMTVQGVVSSNRQFVRLTINPVFTTITKVNTFKYVGEDTATSTTEISAKGDTALPTSGDERSSKATASASTSGVSIQLPTLATLSVSTTVSVPDGGTVLLGGIKRLKEGRADSGTPILNKIPYINRLFMNTAIGRETQSILMMVTPRIIIQEEEEEYLTGNVAP